MRDYSEFVQFVVEKSGLRKPARNTSPAYMEGESRYDFRRDAK